MVEWPFLLASPSVTNFCFMGRLCLYEDDPQSYLPLYSALHHMPALRTLRISLLSEFYTFPAFRIEDPSMIVLSCVKDLYIHGESDSGSIFLLLDILVLPATVNIDIQDIATNWKKKTVLATGQISLHNYRSSCGALIHAHSDRNMSRSLTIP